MAILVLASDMQADSVQQAGMALGIIYDDIVPRGEGVDGGNDALIAEIVEECIFLLLEFSEYPLQLLVIAGVAGHHPGAHRVSQSPVRRSLCICLPDLRVIGQSQVVVQGPVQYRDAVECHMRSQFTLETRIHVVAETLLEILAYRASGISLDPVENI